MDKCLHLLASQFKLVSCRMHLKLMFEVTAFSSVALVHSKNAEWTIMSAQWITAVYHVWEMDAIVTVTQTAQTMKMRLNAVSEI